MSKAKMENAALPKRFYAAAGVAPSAEGFGIVLDGKPVRTPGRHLLQVAERDLAEAIAAEWQAQQEVIDPHQMPLTRLCYIALDRVAADRQELLADIARYAETDLVCYRVPGADAEVLRARQDAAFEPVLRWVSDRFGAAFAVTDSVLPAPQPAASLAAIAAVFAAATDAELAALAMMVPLLGSALLTLAVWHRFMEVDAAFHAARLDEQMQAERWGVDPEQEAAWQAKCRDVRACGFFLTYNQLKILP